MTRTERQLTEIFEAHETDNVSRKVVEVTSFSGWKPQIIVLPDMMDAPSMPPEHAEESTANA